MRKEIAYDALQLTLTQRLIANNGSYWGINLRVIKDTVRQEGSKVFQKALIDLPQNCAVCARGALMVSQIRLGNELHPCSSEIAKGNATNIKGFTTSDFITMENYYEYKDYKAFDTITKKSYLLFGDIYVARKYRLINIFLNVLTNGNFNNDAEIDYIQKYNLDLNLFTKDAETQNAIKKVWENNPIK